MKTTNEIEALKKRVSVLTDDLSTAKKELLTAQIELSPVQIGDLIKSKRGVIHKVAAIRPFMGIFWVSGFPTLKSGEFGKRTVNLYGDWEKA